MSGGGKGTLIAIISTLVVAFILWVGANVVSHGQEIASGRVRQDVMERWLERIESKLDQVLKR